MRRTSWISLCLLLTLESNLLGAMALAGAGRATTSPPEGNTTLADGTKWCVAVVGVSEADLQNALDWTCGMGLADCRPIQHGGPCYEPNNILTHATYAFNSYYQLNGNSDAACNFGGTATITKHDPSYEKCSFAASGPTSSGVAKSQTFMLWKFTSILVLLYLRK